MIPFAILIKRYIIFYKIYKTFLVIFNKESVNNVTKNEQSSKL
jgi:hypothetical protein